jgi:hypothetical protein
MQIPLFLDTITNGEVDSFLKKHQADFFDLKAKAYYNFN